MAQPWKKRPGESGKAFAAFTAYCEIGLDRSLVVVGRKCNKSVSLLGRWSAAFAWVDRAAAWDEYMAEAERRAAELQARERAKVWLDRDERLREKRYTQAMKALEKADSMLQFPLSTKIVEGNDGKTTVVKPARWSLGQAARLIEMGYEQAQAAIRNEGSLTGEVGDERAEEFVIEDWTPEK